MKDTNTSIKKEYFKELSLKTLKFGRIFTLIAILLVIAFSLQDLTIINTQYFFFWRLCGLIPLILFTILSFTILKKDLKPVILLYSLVFSFVIIMMAGINYVVFTNGYPDNYKLGVIGGLITSIFAAFIFSLGAKKYLIYILTIPFFVLVIALYVTHKLSPLDWSYFSNPGLIIVASILVSFSQERSNFKEFKMRKLLEIRENDLKKEISERLFIEEELKNMNKTLENRVNEAINEIRRKDQLMLIQSRQAAMGEMIGNIAHQWRQPLNTLGIVIQNLQIYDDMNKLDRDYIKKSVDKVLKLIQHMSGTIDDFRNFFKSDKTPEEFSIKDSLIKTISFIEAGFKEHLIKIELDIDSDIKRTGYPDEYNQALLNILNNSKEVFLDRKTPNPNLSIRLFKNNEKSVVLIRDNAGGIPENIIDKIFDPYFSTKDNGTGIGLYMSKIIIEKNMKGSLSARNVSGGAEFRIEL